MIEGEMPQIGVLVGPTASGKTALGVAVAKRMQAEIISADSIQIYRDIHIGSAKPTVQEMEGIPHHLLDIADIDGPRFSVAQYQTLAQETIRKIFAAGKYPLVVGGTGLYISALTGNLDFSAAAGDEELRASLAAQEKEHPGILYSMLREEDPVSYARLHPNDTKRIIRALEVKRLTGQPIGASFEKRAGEGSLPYAVTIVGLTMPRQLLYSRIEARVDTMMEQGLLEEVRELWDRGYNRELPALQGLGYKQLFAYFAGECSLDKAVEDIKRETRHFAKRQLTWFRRDKRITWLDITQYNGDGIVDAACALFAARPEV